MSVLSSRSRRSGKRPRRTTARTLSGPRIRDLIGAIAAIEEEGGAGTLSLVGEARLEVSNLDKRFFPKRGYTKGDLMAYYASVSPFILPAITDRPLVMKRLPSQRVSCPRIAKRARRP